MPDATAARAPLTRRSNALIWGSLAFIALLVTLTVTGVIDETGAYAGAILYGLFATAFSVVAARSLGAGPQRTQWLLIGASIGCFIGGDIATVAGGTGDMVMLAVAQTLYLAQFVTVCAGMMMAALSYRSLLDIRASAIVAFGIAALAAAAVTFVGSVSGFGAANLAGIYRFLAVVFPIADFLVIVGPALFVLLVSRQMGGARFAWPWMAVSAGAAVFAMTDVSYYYLQGWQGDLNMGFIVVGAGRLVSALLFAVGASIARDVFAL